MKVRGGVNGARHWIRKDDFGGVEAKPQSDLQGVFMWIAAQTYEPRHA
jgi:hypothetical protein